jgi:hypothetical protein
MDGDAISDTTKQRHANKPAATPGFAIQLTPDTELGMAMLMIEDEEGNYEPLSPVSTIKEGKWMAGCDLRLRLKNIEKGHDPGLCPHVYKLWARGLDGIYQIAATWKASEL